MQYRKTKKELYIGFFVIVFFSLLISWYFFSCDLSNKLEIFYYGNNSSSYAGQTAQIFWDSGNGFNEKESMTESIAKRKVSFSLHNFENTEKIRIDLSDSDQPFGVDKIRIRSGVFSLLEIEGKDLAANGVFEGVDKIEDKNNAVILQADLADAQYFFSDDIQEIVIRKLNNTFFYRMYLFLLTASACLVLMVWWSFCIKKQNGRMYTFLSTVLIAIWFLVLVMSSLSETYAHPDEDETRHAIDYYLMNWKLPNLLDEKVENVFSNYGMTRLNELSVYYLLAGKVGLVCKQVFHIYPYFRMMNVLVFLLCVIVALYWGKKNLFVFIPILIAPQVWYVFSYATSDAWDFFLSYLIIGEIFMEDSLLNRAIKQGKTIYLVIYGILCALLFMGKANFYAVLLLAFIVFFFRWMEVQFDFALLKKYVIIGISFGVTIIGRLALDITVYGGKKAEMYQMAQSLHRSSEIEQMVTYKDQGLSLIEACVNFDFLKSNFHSFVGNYGWMNKPSSPLYYTLMSICYIVMLFAGVYLILRERNVQKKLLLICSLLVACLSVFLSMYRSWAIDYQPQGRYLFPILLVIFVMTNVLKDKINYRCISTWLTLVTLMGIWSFIGSGIVQTVIL